MAYDRERPSAAASTTGAAPAGATPGRAGRALTDGMYRATGIPVVDEGMGCEGPEPLPSCWLTDASRARLHTILVSRVGLAHANYQAAVASKRIETLLSTSGGWGFAAELICNILTFSIGGAVVGAVARMRKGAASAAADDALRVALGGEARGPAAVAAIAMRVQDQTIKDSVAHLGRATRSHVKESAKALPPGAASKAAFLHLVSGGATRLAAYVTEDLPSVLDDDGLLLLVESYQHEAHTLAAYAASVDDLLSRYQASEIDLVGRSWEHDPSMREASTERPGRLDVVRVVHGARSRSALVEQPHVHQRSDEARPGAPRPTDPATISAVTWIRWLDDDLAGVAGEAYAERVGAPLVLDAAAGPLPPALAGPVSAWIATPEGP